MAGPLASEAHIAGQHTISESWSYPDWPLSCLFSLLAQAHTSIKPQVSALVLLDPPDLMPVLVASGGAAAGSGEVTVQPATIATGGVRLRAMLERLLKLAKLQTVDLPFDALVPSHLGPTPRASGCLTYARHPFTLPCEYLVHRSRLRRTPVTITA